MNSTFSSSESSIKTNNPKRAMAIPENTAESIDKAMILRRTLLSSALIVRILCESSLSLSGLFIFLSVSHRISNFPPDSR